MIVTGQKMNILLLDKLNCVDAIRVATATVIKFFGKEKGKDVFETKCDLIDSVNVVVDENKCYALYCCLVFVFFDVFRVVLLCFAFHGCQSNTNKKPKSCVKSLWFTVYLKTKRTNGSQNKEETRTHLDSSMLSVM